MSGRIDARPPDAFTGPAIFRTFEHPVPLPSGEYRWVYLWQLPLRLTHWIAAISIVVLFLTGFYIGRPYFMPPIAPAMASTHSVTTPTTFLSAARDMNPAK